MLVKVLAKAPADRYATAGEFVGALARSPEAEPMAQGPVTVVAPPPSPPPSYAPPTPPPSYAPPPAAYTPPPTFYPPASAAAPVPVTPTWVLVLLGVGGVVSLVLGGLFLLYLFSPDADTRNGALLLGVPLVILAVLHGLALFGLAQRHSWARGMGFVAAVFLCLTCVGVVIGAPLIYGLVRTRTAD